MQQMNFEPGNPQQDAPKRIRKRRPHRRRRGLLALAAAVLAAVLLFVLLDRSAFDGLRRSVAYFRAEKDASGCARLYSYSGDGTDAYASLGGSFLVASNQEITLLDESGNTLYHEAVEYAHAAVTARDGCAAVYDIGGTEIALFDSSGLITRLAADGEIYDARMGADGRLAVTLKKTGYKTAACVYTGKGELLYAFHSAENYLMTAAVSDDGKYLAAAAMGQDEGTFVSSALLYRLNSETLHACAALEGGVYELGTVKGRFCAATESALCFVKTGGETIVYSYEGASLSRCSLGERFAAVLLENYRSGGQTQLVTVASSGEEIASLTMEDDVLDLSAAGRYLAVLYSDRLVIYDRKLSVCSELKDVSSARRVLMRSDGSAVLAGTNTASLYLP